MGRRSINGHSRKRKTAFKMAASAEASSPLKAEGSKAVTQLELDRSFRRKRKAKWYATGEGRNPGMDYSEQEGELQSLASIGQYIPPDSAI